MTSDHDGQESAIISAGIRNRTLYHPRSTNAGLITSVLGGRIAVLSYYPKTRNSRSISEYVSSKSNDDIFRPIYLRHPKFLTALNEIAFSPAHPTLRVKRLARVSAIKSIRLAIFNWLSKALDYRENSNVCVEKFSEDSLLKEFLDRDEVESKTKSLVTKLSNLLQQQLSKHDKTSRYAFHPKLLSPIKKQIRFLLLNSHNQKVGKDVGNVIYLHMKNLRVVNMETLSSPHLWGMPSKIAFAGMCHKFELNLEKLGFSKIKVMGEACFIHSYQVNAKNSLPEYYRLIKEKGCDVPKPDRSTLYSRPKSTMKIDLVLRLINFDEEKEAPSIMQFYKGLRGLRLAGGSIFPEFEQPEALINLYQTPTDLFNRISLMPRNGCWLYPSTLRVKNFTELADTLNEYTELKPVNIGYAFLEEPKSRAGAITNKHCYAESVIGLARCVSAIEVRVNGCRSFWRDAFWATYDGPHKLDR